MQRLMHRGLGLHVPLAAQHVSTHCSPNCSPAMAWLFTARQLWSPTVCVASASPADRASSSGRRPGDSRGGRKGPSAGRGRSQPAPKPISQPPTTPGSDPWSQGVTPVTAASGRTPSVKPARHKQTSAKTPAAASTTAGLAPSQHSQPKVTTSKSTASSSNSHSVLASTASSSSTVDNLTPEQHQANFMQAVKTHMLSEEQVRQLNTYLDYLLETNQVMNLTAIRDRNEALTRHLVDSLALLPVLDQHLAAIPPAEYPPATPGIKLIDVGTGAGLPGMVLAIARPHWQVTLLDSLRKRCDFLQRAAELAGLTNVQVVWSRAEDGGREPELREEHDVAVARAVADARVLAELCLPFVRPGGLWVAAKGPDPEAEVEAAGAAITKLGGVKLALHRVQSFAAGKQMTALVVSKTKHTPSAYPRSPGTPNKSPL